MATIDTRGGLLGQPAAERPYHETYKQAEHYRSKGEEFDAVKIGTWLFLTTEVLLFSGLFVAYGVFRYLYPDAFYNGSQYLDWQWGALNTVVLLVSSWTIATAVRNAQLNQNAALIRNLTLTLICAIAFIFIKVTFEYYPKAMEGKLPGKFFSYPFASDPNEPLWWAVYWVATGIHASHVIIGIGLITWLIFRARKNHFGPGHYTAVEVTALYWHIVDLVWIFLFPLLYLIH